VKFAISGTHGSGKSTLLGAMGSRGDLHILEEIPRLVTEELGDQRALARGINTPARQTLILGRQMSAEGQGLDHVALLCDRSIVDHWAYTTVLFPTWSSSDEGLAWGRTVRAWAGTYHHVVVLPSPDWGSVDDGVREADLEFQHEIAARIEELLEEFDVPHTVCVPSSLQERVRYLERLLFRTNEEPQ